MDDKAMNYLRKEICEDLEEMEKCVEELKKIEKELKEGE